MSILHHWLVPHESNNKRARLLHPSSLSLLIGFFAVFQLFLGQMTRSFPNILGYASQIPPEEVIRLTNIERKNNGLSELSFDPLLSAAAAQKAADMFARDYWAHVSPAGTQPWFFITQSGYSYRYAGENLARDFSDPASVIRAWMDSPTHKDNLLNNRYQDIGIAVVDGQLGGRETTLVVQMLGTKLSAQPAVAGNGTNAVAVRQVKAAEISPIPLVSPTAMPEITPTLPTFVAESAPVSPFGVTRGMSLAILVLIIGVLVVDVVAVRRQKIVRWTSRSAAHLAFMVFLLAAALIVYRGQIL
jgi:hypothetical protein